MDDFVRDKLSEWNLSEFIDTFKGQDIDKESFYCLDDKDIADLIPTVGPRSKFKKRLKLLKKEQKTGNPEVVDSSAQACASTSDRSNQGKRRSGLQGESSQWQSSNKRPRFDTEPGSYKAEEILLSDVKNIMNFVHQKIPQQDNKLNNFLRRKINDLETDKREVVGVFGRTGAGKSYLINAVIGERNLLPSGSVNACTSVMIKVEANEQNSKYEADIEFITKEEWEEELWFSKNFLRESADRGRDEDEEKDRKDIVEKLSVLYGEDWENKSPEELMDGKYFKEIPEFLLSKRKMLTGQTAEGLSEKCVIYTKSKSKDEKVKAKRWYWPLVKCVTIRVPNNDLLKHVTLVDLPGNGDRNKSRDKMWKTIVGSCSTVWIVTEINRAASEPEAWEILKSACSFMGNAGQCRQIHFICSKSDESSNDPARPSTDVRAFILERNQEAKKEVRNEFRKLNEVTKYFSDGSFKVFTVSSFEFLRKTVLDPDETEIPELQEFLQGLNDCHSVTLNYVKGALGILSLIQGASRRDGVDIKTAVCTELEQKMKDALQKVVNSMEETQQAFKECLSEGVRKSESSWETNLTSVIKPENMSGRGFHRTLKCIVQHDGAYKPTKGKLINLNMKLSSCLTKSIDDKFKKTFPNEGECGQFNRVLDLFSLNTKTMRKNRKYKDVKLQLMFLSTEEDKIKTKLNKIIRDRKKTIYSSLTTTIETSMQECYDVAKQIKGHGCLEKIRTTLTNHVLESKDVMFQTAKDVMLNKLRDLMREILEDLEEMQESIDLTLKTDDVSIPDVENELEMVKNHYEELKRGPDEEPLICIN
ncbi:nuclear GTPase SLIP-GC-like isoform X2 [Pseudoliparis swirei]|uniref:nuclear GTPase SLIP-GC-like isoform X2 n=1 Tax=Pseudoliparis swirei TaxID=2059687 RepID=UPI0024BEBF69|nr:nuclear GTPase SLIP-GC-like isoform X2 [Pseudoliparis swirei]